MNHINIIEDLFIKSIKAEIKYRIIFGAGDYGELLEQNFRKAKIKIDFYCDNNVKKHGTKINDIECISFDKLKNLSGKALVFVSPRKTEIAETIYRQLDENKIDYVFPKELLKIFIFIPEMESNLPSIGHYYSLYPNFAEIERKADMIFNKNKIIHDVDLNENRQLNILHMMIELYSSIPTWKDSVASSDLRYYFENGMFPAGDAIALHCMLRILNPKRFIEVGSGFSSAVTLDTNEYYLNNNVELSFIEPYPARLKSILKPNDNIELHKKGLQEMPIEFFEKLESGDILFIDSSHVSKVNSDVNYLFFEILPHLNKGVYIHFHDIFYPFEYPKEWILREGKIWNEIYLLRAFLQNNQNYSIQFFQNMIQQKYMNIIMTKWTIKIPAYGGSIWIRKDN